MDGARVAPVVGIVACLAVLCVLAVPYFVIDAPAVGTYYSSGAISPLIGGLFALVAIIVFAAGRQGRSDPEISAGAVLALGGFVALLAFAWALTVPVDLVFGLSTETVLENHRWFLVAVAVAVPASAAWYSRALGLL